MNDNKGIDEIFYSLIIWKGVRMKLIVAVDENWGIGYQDDLLVSIPEDMALFKSITSTTKGNKENAVIMGRKTFESIGKPLPGRMNYILSRKGISYNPKLNVDHTAYSCLSTIDEILYDIKRLGLEDHTFVIGGAEIYKQFIDYCSGLYVTKIHHAFKDVDTYFPVDLDKDERFSIISQTTQRRYKDYYYSFCEYIQPKYKKIGDDIYGKSTVR